MRIAIAMLSLIAANHVAAANQYDMTVRVDAAKRTMRVEGRVTFIAGDGFHLILSKRMRNVRFELVEPAGLVVDHRGSHERGGNAVWTFRTGKRDSEGSRVTMAFGYDGSGETTNQYHIGPEVSFASAFGTDWYPAVDTSEARGVGRLRFYVEPAHDVVASGRRVADRRTVSHRVIDYHVQYATYFAFVAGAFHVHERSAAVPLKAYLLSERNNAGTWLDGVAAIVAVLQKEFGTYPFEELSFVEIPRDVATAASFNAAALQGFILLNHRSLDVPDISLLWEWIAHEVGHMWFPHYVSFTRPGGRFMEEALAQYGAQRVVEALGGSDLARQSRISGYPPDPIYSATAYFRLVDGGIDHPIGALQRLPGHSDLAYTKGSMVFHMLSRSVGRERFRDALRKTTNASPYQTMPWWKFLSELERHAAVDLSAFYDQWFHRVGAPSWTFTWRNVDQAVEVTIRQTEPAYTLDLPIRVTVQDGAIVETEIRVVSSEETHLIPSIPAINVELDPDFHVLHRPNAVPSEKVGKMRQVLERLGSYTERRHEFSRELKALPRRPSDHGR